ncbi:ABC transporter permease [Haliea sp. AH-315-K21]|uniref:ABC transmembrane type-1 domain-containing protein n=1 Tax=SAR86 cluster bacterium TaxID=2030880 RepID=A0A2A5C7S4_9GAMM|nr:ABC transporter permease [Haliea sp. AH-315-K21]PCJ39635.1 MAG: hypothetical protein COA71_13390 [SAR86 cluster bacterium]
MQDSSLSSYSPKPADFIPLTKQLDKHGISRPSLSYWQDAWIRLKKNKRAISSLYLIIGLLAFTLIGPLLWSINPNLQDLDAISQGPSFSKQALIVETPANWGGVTIDNFPSQPSPNFSGLLSSTEQIEIVGQATTQYVRLSWQPVEGASAYLIYRNDHIPESPEDLGLPLGQTLAGNQVSFEDRLQLNAQAYYYTIIATDGFNEASTFTTQQVDLTLAISARQADLRNIDVEVGATVSLPGHPFGTDYLGRDMLARTMYGARVSLFIGIIAPFIFVLFGTLYGGLAGYLGGSMDNYMMRVADFVIALPFLLFMILFKVSFGIGPGENGIIPMMLALILLAWPGTARVVRGQVLLIREADYIQAARLLGANTFYLLYRHIIPNAMGPILVTLTFAVPMAIFTEAFLSFIGMGVAPPTASWGSMSNQGIRNMLSSPHELFFPALFISITVLAFNLLGDGLRDALDTRMRGNE